MEIKQAMIEAKETDLWFRPISWKGSGQAIVVRIGNYCGDVLQIVPSAKGGIDWIATAKEILDDWEVVSPDVVCNERG